jgi:radical SAM superfamily enzyme
LLYVACKDTQDIDFKEYTIKDDIEHIVTDILAQQVNIVGISVYIWNIEQTRELCKQLKERKPEIIIVLGGPEVSYEIDYFLDTFTIDYVISGEGEVVLSLLLNQLEQGQEIHIQGVSSKENRDYQQTVPVSLSYIETLDSPYVLPRDIKDMKHRILYFETSRGCPYQCQYCLSSLEKGLRFFSQEYLTKQLDLILQTEVKTIKFLDRSFNAKTEHALLIIDYISNHYQEGQQFQFEINGDVLDQRILDVITKQVPKNLFRFEIGIQSTYQPTNEVVKRYQNFERLSEVIQQLQDSQRVDLHLDLIAGLPLETLPRFATSFDDVFAFQPKELQLGFLKLLRGTKLRLEYETYGYHFDEKAPYEITSSNDLSQSDIKDIHLVEDMLEKYWNSGKMPLTMHEIMHQIISPFTFFLELGKYYQEQGFKTIQYQNDELFYYFYQYTVEHQVDVLDLLIEDYLRLSKSKPKRWWTRTLNKEQSKQRMHVMIEEHQLSKEMVFRYGRLERGNHYDILAIYQNYQVQIYKSRIK